jgi:3-phosphoshikimate 1-carboxyvinyltransferase
MDLTIYPSKLAGEVTPPSSKSQAHRALIAAALGGVYDILGNSCYSILFI